MVIRSGEKTEMVITVESDEDALEKIEEKAFTTKWMLFLFGDQSE